MTSKGPLILFGSYMIRYPLGGMISYVLQWLVGLKRLGCDVVFVEHANYHGACFDPDRGDSLTFSLASVSAPELFSNLSVDPAGGRLAIAYAPYVSGRSEVMAS